MARMETRHAPSLPAEIETAVPTQETSLRQYTGGGDPRAVAIGVACLIQDVLGEDLFVRRSKRDVLRLRAAMDVEEEAWLLDTLNRRYGPNLGLEDLIFGVRHVVFTAQSIRDGEPATTASLAARMGFSEKTLAALEFRPRIQKLTSDLASGLVSRMLGSVHISVWASALRGERGGMQNYLLRFDPNYPETDRSEGGAPNFQAMTEEERMKAFVRLRKQAGILPEPPDADE